LEQYVLQVAWLVWAMHLLAEGACAVAAFFFYFSLFESEPIYMGGFALIAYLVQGIYQVGIKAPRLSPLMDHIIWWRLAIAILGWPVHQAIVEFRAKLEEADEQNPPIMADSEWMQQTLFWTLARWVAVWWLTAGLTFIIAIFIDQAGLLS
jgi:hypothetical protein